MPNILRVTDTQRAYFDCPICERAGTPGVPMSRDSYLFKCPFSHQLTQAELSRFKLTMNKMDELLQESPNPEAIAWKVYVMPQIKARLEEKFHGRLWVTLGTLFDCLASDSVIFVSGEDAGKLKQKGLGSGAAIIAALDSVTQLEKDRNDALAKLSEMMNMIKSLTGE